MPKHALIMIVLGVALSAAFAARLTPATQGLITAKSAAGVLSGKARAAFESYCKARETAGLDAAEGCGESKTEDASGELSGETATARDSWQGAKAAADKAEAAAAALTEEPPLARVAAWFSLGGIGFLVGLGLLIGGGLIARRASAGEGAAKSDDKGEAQDFGAALSQLSEEVAQVQKRLDGEVSVAEGASCRDEIDRIRTERIEAIVATRNQLTNRYGLLGLSEVFGPFSAGERRLNRTWSALVDEHWPEAKISIAGAAESLKEAQVALGRLTKS